MVLKFVLQYIIQDKDEWDGVMEHHAESLKKVGANIEGDENGGEINIALMLPKHLAERLEAFLEAVTGMNGVYMSGSTSVFYSKKSEDCLLTQVYDSMAQWWYSDETAEGRDMGDLENHMRQLWEDKER